MRYQVIPCLPLNKIKKRMEKAIQRDPLLIEEGKRRRTWQDIHWFTKEHEKAINPSIFFQIKT